MTDLLIFLRARLDDDERVARMQHRHTCGHNNVERGSGCHCDWSIWYRLDDLEAKRRILDEHQPYGSGPDVECTTCAYPRGKDYPCPTVRLLALPYLEHPEFKEEWRP